MGKTGVYVIAADVGTTGCKTRLLRLDSGIEIIGAQYATYPLHTTSDGGVEQNPDDWWQGLCSSIKAVAKERPEEFARVSGIAFCCQMQGSIHVDRNGRPLRNAMIYMDGRSHEQLRRGLQTGLVRVQGLNLFKTLRSLRVAGGVSTSPKDPVWKYHWVRENEPHLFEKTYKWLDVKDYLLLQLTGNVAMTRDSANATFLFDTRPKNLRWDAGLCRTFDIDMAHLPEVVSASDVVGTVTRTAADQTGLPEGIRVFGGGGDASLIPLGAGCVGLYDTHIYSGTSGWVISNVDKRIVDPIHFVASILGAQPGRYNLIGEQEVSGFCLDWMKNRLMGHSQTDTGPSGDSFDAFERAIASVPAGSGGLVFAPWLQGLRAPSEFPAARGVFFNLGLATTGAHLARAVVEGIAFQTRWILEAVEHHVPRQAELRFVGGGARLPSFPQILANVTGRVIRMPEHPQDAGVLGVGLVCGLGLGLIGSFDDVKTIVPLTRTVQPEPETIRLYEDQFQVFRTLLAKNKKSFLILNSSEHK